MAVSAVEPVSSHPRDGRPVPRWAHTIAHLIPLTTLPSGLWRICVALGIDVGMRDHGEKLAMSSVWESLYLIALSGVVECLALLAFGLVRPWGERAPGWMPVIGGRRVVPWVAITAASAGSLMTTAVALMLFLPRDGVSQVEATDTGLAVGVACYVPLLAWGPLLAALTYGYYRRRCRD